MYGLIGKMMAALGQRDALIAILLEGISGMPGCQSYIVAHDLTDANAIWITEVWDNQESHQASLSLHSVQQTISRARPLIAGFGPTYVISIAPANSASIAAGPAFGCLLPCSLRPAHAAVVQGRRTSRCSRWPAPARPG